MTAPYAVNQGTGMVAGMALLGREFIAVPDDRKYQIVFKWPDITIRRYTRAIVNADEMAMFVNTGQVVQTLGPGRHQIDANELPGLGVVIDHVSGGNAYRAELYFVGTREYTGFKFGGRVDDVQDPRTGLVVTLRVCGDYALRIDARGPFPYTARSSFSGACARGPRAHQIRLNDPWLTTPAPRKRSARSNAAPNPTNSRNARCAGARPRCRR